jgi:Uma2 family endonuclease
MITMDATAIRAKMTAGEYFQLPETTQPQHLIDGEIVEMPAPNLAHQEIIVRLAAWLFNKLSEIKGKVFIAPTDVVLDKTNIVQPDVLWVAEERLSILDVNRVMGAPDFVAEVLSPSTARFDRRVKFRLYERFGVRELWLVDPAAQLIEVWRLDGGKFQFIDAYGTGETFESALFGAVEVNLIFPQPTPTA